MARRRPLRRLGRAVRRCSAGTRRSTPAASMRERYLGTLPGRRAAAVGPHRRRPRGRLPGRGSTARRSRTASARRAASRKGTLLHHTNVEDAEADAAQARLLRLRRRLRPDADEAERLVALRTLDAHKPTVPRRAAPPARVQRRPRARPHRAAGGVRAGGRHALAHSLRQDWSRRVHLAPGHDAPHHPRLSAGAARDDLFQGLSSQAAADVRARARARRRRARRILRRQDRLRRRGRDAAGAAARGGARGARRARGGEARRRGSGDLASCSIAPDWAAWLPSAPAQLRTEELVVSACRSACGRPSTSRAISTACASSTATKRRRLRAALDWPDRRRHRRLPPAHRAQRRRQAERGHRGAHRRRAARGHALRAHRDVGAARRRARRADGARPATHSASGRGASGPRAP